MYSLQHGQDMHFKTPRCSQSFEEQVEKEESYCHKCTEMHPTGGMEATLHLA